MSKIEKKITTKKDFSYKKDGCVLTFTLNVDSNEELNAFKECLLEAISDIKKISS